LSKGAIMTRFKKDVTLKTPWAILSAQSSKVLIWFIAPVFLNFVGYLLNLRVKGIVGKQLEHQLLFVILCATFIGGLDLICNRQEYIATLPVSRNKVLFNRIFNGLVFVAICASIDFVILNGFAEHSLFGEVLMPVYHFTEWLKWCVLLTATMVFTVSTAIVARTYTGLLIAPLITAMFFLTSYICEVSIVSDIFIISLVVATALVLIGSMYEFKKIAQVRTSIGALATVGVVNITAALTLIGTAIWIFINAEGGL